MALEIRYGGFWRRFAAFGLDALFRSPLAALVYWASANSRRFNCWYLIPGLCVGIAYNVVLVKHLTATPGKLVVGLRIAKVDGSPIGYREVMLRYAPEFVLGIASGSALLLAIAQLTDADYLALGFRQRARVLESLCPPWFKPIQWVYQGWILSEFVVLLTNRKRRALHDFVAGTVVALTRYNPELDLVGQAPLLRQSMDGATPPPGLGRALKRPGPSGGPGG